MVYTVHAWRILTYFTVLLILKSGQLIRFGNVVIVLINADTWVMLRVACSRRSDSGERCKVKGSAKK